MTRASSLWLPKISCPSSGGGGGAPPSQKNSTKTKTGRKTKWSDFVHQDIIWHVLAAETSSLLLEASSPFTRLRISAARNASDSSSSRFALLSATISLACPLKLILVPTRVPLRMLLQCLGRYCESCLWGLTFIDFELFIVWVCFEIFEPPHKDSLPSCITWI